MGRTIDFTGVGDFTPAPSGGYTLEFASFEFAEIKSGKNAGADQVKAKYTITDETAEDGTRVSGKPVWRNYQLVPQALWVLKQDAVALGVSPDRFDGEVDIEAILGEMVGRKAIGQLSVQEYTYPNDHAKAGQKRYSNNIEKLEPMDLPEVLQAGGGRRRG